MQTIVGHFSTTMQEMRSNQYQELSKLFQQKLLKSLSGIGAVLDEQVKKEKAANAQQLKEVSEGTTLATFTQAMK